MENRIVQVSEIKYTVEITQTPPSVVQVIKVEPEIRPNEKAEVRVQITPPPVNILRVSETQQAVQVSQTEIRVVEMGVPGPPGPRGLQGIPGTGGDRIIGDYLAGQALGGQRVVIVGSDGKIYYADSANLAHINRVLGITTGAAEQEAAGSVQASGIMTEPTWNWDLGNFIYLGSKGLLTQIPPATGFFLEIGWPITPTSMMVQIEFPILLA